MQFSSKIGSRLIEALQIAGEVAERMYLEGRAVKIAEGMKEIRVDPANLNKYILACDKQITEYRHHLESAKSQENVAWRISHRLHIAEFEFLISIFWYVLRDGDLEEANWGAIKFVS